MGTAHRIAAKVLATWAAAMALVKVGTLAHVSCCQVNAASVSKLHNGGRLVVGKCLQLWPGMGTQPRQLDGAHQQSVHRTVDALYLHTKMRLLAPYGDL